MCYKRKCNSQTNSYSSAFENGLTLNFDNVQVNLNRLSQNELDYLCDKEGDESSDSDFEVTVDHVEPASSEVIKVKHSFEDGLLSLVLLTCDCGSTRSASARRWGGNRFESRLNTAMTLKMVSTDTMSGALHL